MPIQFFVRDRLEADYSLWKRNGLDESLRLAWAKDQRLLEFLDEHRKLENQTERSNSLSIFSASTDLCDIIERRLQEQILPIQLMDALRTNAMPLFSCKLTTNELVFGNIPSIQLKLSCRNVGSSPAFSVETKWSTETDRHTQPLVALGESVSPVVIANIAGYSDISVDLEIAYETAFGIRVVESNHVGCIFQRGIQNSMLTGTTLNHRRFVRSQRPSIKLEER